MQNIIVVNGEGFWPAYLPGFNVQRVRLQESRWALARRRAVGAGRFPTPFASTACCGASGPCARTRATARRWR
jgi:hypothetical protein